MIPLLSRLGGPAQAPANMAPNPRFVSWPFGAGPYTELGECAAGYTLAPGLDSVQAVTQQPGMVDSPFCLQWDITASGSEASVLAFGLSDVRRLAGKTVTLSFVARAENAGAVLSAQMRQVFGTGGSTSLTGAEQAVTLSTDPQRLEMSFVIPSAAGKTILASQSVDHTQVRFLRNVGAGTGKIWIEDIKFEIGPWATTFVGPTPEESRAIAPQAAANNLVENPSFAIWQRKTSFAIAAAGVVRVADRWKANRAGGGYTVSRQAGFAGADFCARVQRDAGNTSAFVIFLGQQIESAVAKRLAGQWVVLSYDARLGADFSGANKQVNLGLATGTGIDEAYTPTTGAAFPTGNTGRTLAMVNSGQRLSSAFSKRVSSYPFLVPADTTELAFHWSYTPAGTAGANDYVEVTNAKLELASLYGVATDFVPLSIGDTLRQCRRHIRKSFALATAPAQNVGAGTGEIRAPAPVGGMATQRFPTIMFGERMRVAPTNAVTIYNPAAANGQVRDMMAGADCSATTVARITDAGFDLSCTSPLGTSAGTDLAFHYFADAEL